MQFAAPVLHSSTSLQVMPSPLQPALQVHLNVPGRFSQVACGEQLAVPAAHSSSSVQVVPSPPNPWLQVQRGVSPVVSQVAFGSQVSVPHRPAGVQDWPLPVNP
jgi:hypothetical protein